MARSGYGQAEFETYGVPEPADAIVACTSLHHVAEVGRVLDLAGAALIPGGVVVVVEWTWDRFDEAIAAWCFGRLAPPEDEPGWLSDRLAEWRASGRAWDVLPVVGGRRSPAFGPPAFSLPAGAVRGRALRCQGKMIPAVRAMVTPGAAWPGQPGPCGWR